MRDSRLATIWHAPGRMWAAGLQAASITLWWRFGAALVVSFSLHWILWIAWKGPWPAEAWKPRLDFFFWNSMAAWFALIICIVALFDFRLTFSASKTGVSANMAGADDEPLQQVTREAETKASIGLPLGAPPADDTGELPPDQRVKL